MPATSFERHAVQRYFESKLGCRDLTHWKAFKPGLKAYILSSQDVSALTPLLVQDAVALYIKALQSFSQALMALKRKEFAWPMVEFYYAVFYSIRCELYASSIIAVKNGSIFYMPNIAGSTFSHIQEKGSHQAYITLRRIMPANVIAHDILLDNEIVPGKNVYLWMCDNRERVNYLQMHFPDPEPDVVLQKIYDNYILTGKQTDLLYLYETDIIYCFDKDHATVAVPYKKLRICRDLLLGRAKLDPFEQRQLESVRYDLLSTGIDTTIVNDLFL